MALISFFNVSSVAEDIRIDADFPGGNVALERIAGSDVYLHQELRDTQGWWFYWNFRVRGAQGRALTFHFDGKPVFDRQGPAVSRDRGETWEWLGPECVKGSSFTHVFAPEDEELRFAFSLPYQEADLQRFLKRHADNPHLVVKELCRSRKGRGVERLAVGCLREDPAFRVLLTGRHHACESAASYVLEGMLDAILADTGDGRWFRNNVEVIAVPFVDKDGVEQGDQGKNRQPRDHNRDYSGESIYTATAALRETVPEWSGGRLAVAIDLHSPYIRDNKIFLVGSGNDKIWQEQQFFSSLLESVANKPLPYRAGDNIPYGTAWNTGHNTRQGRSCSQWASGLDGIRLATTIEIPYGSAHETAVTPEKLRAFGGSLVQALRIYLESTG